MGRTAVNPAYFRSFHCIAVVNFFFTFFLVQMFCINVRVLYVLYSASDCEEVGLRGWAIYRCIVYREKVPFSLQ